MEKGTKGTLNLTASTDVGEGISKKTRVSLGYPRLAHPSSEANMCVCFFLKKSINATVLLHFQCINHPPLFLGWSLAFGQEKKKKASGQINKATLTNKLSINTENSGPAEQGRAASKGAGEHGRHFLTSELLWGGCRN